MSFLQKALILKFKKPEQQEVKYILIDKILDASEDFFIISARKCLIGNTSFDIANFD